MMRPQLALLIAGSARRAGWKALVRLMAITASQRAGGKSCTSSTCCMPALFTRMSTRPNCAALYFIRSSMSAKPLSTMFAPGRARALARPKPMPLVEPVTRAVLPCSMGFPPNELRCNYDAINDAPAAHYSSASALLPDATPMIEPRLHRVLCPGPASPATPATSGTDAPAPAGMHRMAYWEWRGWGAWNDTGHPAHSRVVVCVHGLARQGRDFDSLARALSPHARVICPDVAGRGQSDWLADPMAYQIPQYASDMLALLAQLQQSGPISQMDWVGTSMGGLIGLVIAGQPGLPLPVPVRRLVLNDVGPVIQWQALQRIAQYLGRWGQFDSLQQAADALWSVSSSFGPHTPAQWLELSRAMVRPLPQGGVGTALHPSVAAPPPPGRWGGVARAWVGPLPQGGLALHYDPAIAVPFRAAYSTPDSVTAGEAALWRLYDQITARTLLLRGVQSDLLAPATAQAMAGRGPRAQVVEFEGVGHAPMLMAADQLAAVTQFLLAQ